MDILQGKIIRITLFCIKADGNTLYHSDIVHCTFFFKIRQGDMSALLVYTDRCNGGGDFLYQGKILFPVALACLIDEVLQRGTAQASGIPGRHLPSSSLGILLLKFFHPYLYFISFGDGK